jgi:biopolymer transport protein TolQ
MNDSNLIEIILHASPVVQAAMIILAVMSLASWSVALAKSAQIRKSKRIAKEFEETFLATQDLQTLYYQVEMTHEESQGLSHIFIEGFKEFENLKSRVYKMYRI